MMKNGQVVVVGGVKTTCQFKTFKKFSLKKTVSFSCSNPGGIWWELVTLLTLRQALKNNLHCEPYRIFFTRIIPSGLCESESSYVLRITQGMV